MVRVPNFPSLKLIGGVPWVMISKTVRNQWLRRIVPPLSWSCQRSSINFIISVLYSILKPDYKQYRSFISPRVLWSYSPTTFSITFPKRRDWKLDENCLLSPMLISHKAPTHFRGDSGSCLCIPFNSFPKGLIYPFNIPIKKIKQVQQWHVLNIFRITVRITTLFSRSLQNNYFNIWSDSFFLFLKKRIFISSRHMYFNHSLRTF